MVTVNTITVRRKDGHVCTINEADFDAAEHQKVELEDTGGLPQDDDSGEETTEVNDYNDLTKAELKAEAENRGIEASGNKKALVAALEANDAESEAGE